MVHCVNLLCSPTFHLAVRHARCQRSAPPAVLRRRLLPVTPRRESSLGSQTFLCHGLAGAPCQSKPSSFVQLLQHGRRPARRLPGRFTNHRVAATGGIVPLGFDLLAFLGSTVMVIPLFKKLKISPVLGFLFSGVVLHQLGLIRDVEEIEKLSELGVLFLLFEMGLELSIDRLKALAKYAFGMGSLQMLLSTLIFTAFALPVGQGLGTKIMMQLASAPANLVSIRSVDEAVVIGAALSMSSSAFVLQLLSERGEVATRFGSATLGILLLQDIAVVPFLVLLPVIESNSLVEDASPVSLVQMLGPTALQTVAGLGALLLGGRVILRRIFEVVAQSRNNEAFVALCLLTVAGTSLLTQRLGFSDTLGAFIAGVLLSETNYKTQVEADVKPFRGLLLGLFFVSTGGSINMDVLVSQWQVVLLMLGGLIGIKTAVIAALGSSFGLSRNESIRTGFYLSQGGEFAFVLLSLANELKVLPSNLNQLLIIVVVMSMALTPALAELGKVTSEALDKVQATRKGEDDREGRLAREVADSSAYQDKLVEEPVVLVGFGPQGQMLANMLESPLVPGWNGGKSYTYLAFDLDPMRVATSRKAGFSIVYGDGSRKAVLKAAGVKKPRAIVVCYSETEQSVRVVSQIKTAFPNTPLYATGSDMKHAALLRQAGATYTFISATEAGLAVGASILQNMGVSNGDVIYLREGIQEAMRLRTEALADQLISKKTPASALTSSDVVVLDRDRFGSIVAPARPSDVDMSSPIAATAYLNCDDAQDGVCNAQDVEVAAMVNLEDLEQQAVIRSHLKSQQEPSSSASVGPVESAMVERERQPQHDSSTVAVAGKSIPLMSRSITEDDLNPLARGVRPLQSAVIEADKEE